MALHLDITSPGMGTRIPVYYYVQYMFGPRRSTPKKGVCSKPHQTKLNQCYYSADVGFCKHDRNHDVYLLLEAFSLPSDMSSSGQKCGEGKVAIYPRTNAPRTNYIAAPGEDMYRWVQVLSPLKYHKTRDSRPRVHVNILK